MENININIDKGEPLVITFNDDKDVSVTIYPKDFNILSRYAEVQAKMESEEKKYSELLNMDNVNGNLLEKLSSLNEIDNKIKGYLDYIFNAEISKKVFGDFSCLSINSKGEPVIKEILELLLSKVTAEYEKHKKDAFNKEIKSIKSGKNYNKYMNKYNNKNKYVNK